MRKFLVLLVVAALLALIAGSLAAGPNRKPAVAGSFYPADEAELRQMVETHLARVGNLPEIDGRILALVVPHAGLVYSGQIAAYGYKLLDGNHINKVILCGGAHRYPFDGLSVYGPYVTWSTPLGSIQCENNYTTKLIGFDEKIEFNAAPHLQEHSLEVQLPYLQVALGDFFITPILMGNPSKENIDLLTNALKSLEFDDSTIMVASTDWQHYRSAKDGYPMDSVGMVCLENLDPVRLERALQNHQTEMCGGGTVVAVMRAAITKGANRVKILKYGDSGDISGDKNSVVGYVAAVIYKADLTGDKAKVGGQQGAVEEKKLPDKFELSKDEKKVLLEIARSSLESYLKNGTIPEFKVNDNLNKFGAAFVTLEENGNLRGCIGHTMAVEPLYKTVSTCAVQAGVADPRFPPVDSDEVGRLHIEISVLTPMQKVVSLDEIEVGRDGLMLFKGNSRGLLLPQVAVDYGWDRNQFLQQTCHKAGLSPDAYKDPDAVIYKFQAVVFGE